MLDKNQQTLWQIVNMLQSLLQDESVNDMSLGDWLDLWLVTYKKEYVGRRSYREKAEYIADRIKPVIGEVGLRNLDGLTLQNYINGIEAGNVRDKISLILKESLKKAAQLHKIPENPFLTVTRVGYAKKHYPPLEYDEQKKVLEILKLGYHRDLFIFLCCTGLRISEFLGLDLNREIDLEGHVIRVRRAVDIKTGEIHDYTKSETSRREIPFTGELLPTIRNLREFYAGGRRFNYQMIKTYFNRRFRLLGLKDCCLHSCRHTFISVCGDVEINMKKVQVMAGHADIKMTMNTYTHVLKKGTSLIRHYIEGLRDFVTFDSRENRNI